MNARRRAATTGASLRVSELVLGILGAVAVIMGVVVLFAGEDQYVGVGGESSWRVGDIGLTWALGLLTIGAAIILIDAALVRWDRHRSSRAVAPSSREDLIVHAALFVLVNAFIWVQDLTLSGGVNDAWWITIPWGIGLGVHAVAVFRGGDQPQRR